jgi:hypothetical protein
MLLQIDTSLVTCRDKAMAGGYRRRLSFKIIK